MTNVRQRRKPRPAGSSRHSILLPRLNRVEGQVRGIARMVVRDAPCRDVLIQVAAVREALRRASLVLVEDHLARCTDSPAAAREMLDILEALDT